MPKMKPQVFEKCNAAALHLSLNETVWGCDACTHTHTDNYTNTQKHVMPLLRLV